jgi:anti-sigma B factor antagonist
MALNDAFRCEVVKAPDDDQGNKVTLVKCYGRLVGDASGRLKETVKPLILNGGRIIIDLGAVDHLDSSAIGAMVGLKVSAINHGYCILELENMTPRVLELLRITNLTQMFAK